LTLIYLIFIVISEKIFRSYFGYNSLVVTLLASLTIAILFNPMRAFLAHFIDKNLFGKRIDELSIENFKMRLELEKQDKMKVIATLAAGMAHEIKNPLTSIKTFAEYLPEKYHDPKFRENFKRIVPDEVDRVNYIVQQLLDFAKPKDPILELISINDIVKDTLGLLSNNITKNQISVSNNFTQLNKVLMDKDQFKQAVLNLLINSIQAMPHGGRLSVFTYEKNGSIILSIRDTGQGISKQNLPHLFDPFFSTKENGTGLGLSIVHGIVTKHGGKIEVTSEEGKGTEISVILENRK